MDVSNLWYYTPINVYVADCRIGPCRLDGGLPLCLRVMGSSRSCVGVLPASNDPRGHLWCSVAFAFGFPSAFPKIIPMGQEDASAVLARICALYVSMVAGMFAQYLYARFSLPKRRRPRFDWGNFLAPVLLSPMVFIPLYAVFDKGQDVSRDQYVLFLIAFENGFFFKSYCYLATVPISRENVTGVARVS